MQDLKLSESRREFLKSGVRMFLFGGFAVVGTYLGLRSDSKRDQFSSCFINLPCRKCNKLTDCKEPRAVDLKRRENRSAQKSSSEKDGV